MTDSKPMSGGCGFSGREHAGGRGSQDLLCDGFERGKAAYDEHSFSVGSFSDELVTVGMMSPRLDDCTYLHLLLRITCPVQVLAIGDVLSSYDRETVRKTFILSCCLQHDRWTQEERQTQAGKEGSVGVGLGLSQRGWQLPGRGFVRGSSSLACGTLEKGDILHMVDDVIVDGMPRSQVVVLPRLRLL